MRTLQITGREGDDKQEVEEKFVTLLASIIVGFFSKPMNMKKAIVYLRISNDKQSNHSIDGQRMMIQSWCERNDIEVIDTFTDEGFSARNFDRPDSKD